MIVARGWGVCALLLGSALLLRTLLASARRTILARSGALLIGGSRIGRRGLRGLDRRQGGCHGRAESGVGARQANGKGIVLVPEPDAHGAKFRVGHRNGDHLRLQRRARGGDAIDQTREIKRHVGG